MSSHPKLTPFSYVILVLVGESGAGPHDLVRMMRHGRVYWAAPESQFYAEPKRLAAAGYLEAAKQPGPHARAHALHAHRRRARRAEGVAGDAHALPAHPERAGRPAAGLRVRRSGGIAREP